MTHWHGGFGPRLRLKGKKMIESGSKANRKMQKGDYKADGVTHG
jgi:hypothetical protein